MPLSRSTDINQFLQRRQPQWYRLELLLERVEGSGLLSLSPAEIREFGVLYRRASSDLVSARAKTANAEVLEYLNDLVARSYAQVYRTRRYGIRNVWTFVSADFPALVRKRRAFVAAAAVITLLGTLFGFVAQRADPAAGYYLLPPQMMRILPAAREHLRREPGHVLGPDEMAATSGRILTNNIGVAFMAFALGITLGIGTVGALLFNGFLLGIFAAVAGWGDTSVAFWSLILPHGCIELTAIFIAGAAGLMIGAALLAPGRRSRRDALMERGGEAVLLVLGTIPMFVVAGLIEGFITPPVQIPPAFKLGFAGMTVLLLVGYFGRCGVGGHAEHNLKGAGAASAPGSG